MGRINVVPDVGAPLGVVAVDLISETWQPDWNEWLAYISAVGGYGAAWMGWGGDFAKNWGIASFPWASKKIYDRVRAMGGTEKIARSRARSVTRWPAPATKTPYEGTRLV